MNINKVLNEKNILNTIGLQSGKDYREVKYAKILKENKTVLFQGFNNTYRNKKPNNNNTLTFTDSDEVWSYICQSKCKANLYTRTRRNFLIGMDYFAMAGPVGKANGNDSTQSIIAKRYGISKRTATRRNKYYQNIIKLSDHCEWTFINQILDDVFKFSEETLDKVAKKRFLNAGLSELIALLNNTLLKHKKSGSDKETLSKIEVNYCYESVTEKLAKTELQKIPKCKPKPIEPKPVEFTTEPLNTVSEINDLTLVPESISLVDTLEEVLVLNKDSRNLEEIGDEEIHLCLTSPPYFNAQKYSSGSYVNLTHYEEQMSEHFSEVLRVLQPGRFCLINISDLSIKNSGEKFPLPAMFTMMMVKLGFKYRFKAFWSKTADYKNTGKNMGNFFNHKLPCQYSPNCCVEEILCFQKQGVFSPTKDVNQYEKNENLYSEQFLDWIKDNNFDTDIWLDIPVKSSHKKQGIPAYPIDLPELIISLFTFKNEIVLDNFCGSGTTLQASLNLSRKAIGYEILPERVEYIHKSLQRDTEQVSKKQSKQLSA